MSKTIPTTSTDWQSELNAAAFKYHLLIARVGLVLNIVFGIGDYFNSPNHYVDFLIFRVSASFLTLLVVLYKDKLVNKPEIIVLIPVLAISIQNAFMYSVLKDTEFQKHTLAYIALFIAGGMFILWTPIYSIIVVVVSIVANVILFRMNSTMPLSEILIDGGLLTLTVALLSILLIYSRTNLTKKEIISRLALAESNREMAIKNEIIEEQNKDIIDSINYAKRIQYSLLASKNLLHQNLPEHFIFFKPKDLVSGDFYWAAKLSDGNFAMVNADSTGHGVPGAIMSILNISCLNEAITADKLLQPSEILNATRKKIISHLLNDGSAEGGKDGMDCSLVCFDFTNHKLTYAAANNPIWIVRGKELIALAADRMPIGKHDKDSVDFTQHQIDLQKGDILYTLTDGFPDQFGGTEGKKYKYKPLQNLLLTIANLPMSEQRNVLEKSFNDWKGSHEQIDDVSIIGVRIAD